MLETVTTEVEDYMSWLTSEGTDWAIWVTVAIGIFIGARFLRAIVAGIFRSSKKPANSPTNLIAEFISATSSLYLLILAFSATAPFLMPDLPEQYANGLRIATMIATALQVAFWARVVASAVLEGAVQHHAQDASTLRNARSLISLFLNIAIFAIAIVFILQNLGQNVGALIAGLGVGGIAIALAAQNIFKDLFASLSIILDRPFVRGDFIVWNGYMGNVDRIGLKTTRVKALSGEQLVVSNDQLLSNEIQNFKRMNERRVLVTVGVTYQTPRASLEALPDRIKALIEGRDLCRFDRCHMAGYADSSINFETVFYILSPEYNTYMDEKQEILLDIHALFEEMGIDFAYPTRTLFVQDLGGVEG